jgi:hypothetical protein
MKPNNKLMLIIQVSWQALKYIIAQMPLYVNMKKQLKFAGDKKV